MSKIITYPDKILRKKSKRVDNFNDPEIINLQNELIKTMLAEDGLGLAAPQIGINFKITAIKLDNKATVFINPQIIWKNWFNKQLVEEGCLSFPGIFGLVKRSKSVIIIYQDNQGKYKLFKASGLLATVFQHEIDHLKGRLFIDKIVKYTKGEEITKKLISQADDGER